MPGTRFQNGARQHGGRRHHANGRYGHQDSNANGNHSNNIRRHQGPRNNHNHRARQPHNPNQQRYQNNATQQQNSNTPRHQSSSHSQRPRGNYRPHQQNGGFTNQQGRGRGQDNILNVLAFTGEAPTSLQQGLLKRADEHVRAFKSLRAGNGNMWQTLHNTTAAFPIGFLETMYNTHHEVRRDSSGDVIMEDCTCWFDNGSYPIPDCLLRGFFYMNLVQAYQRNELQVTRTEQIRVAEKVPASFGQDGSYNSMDGDNIW
ncbi:hypothetical protein B0T17DRAFT_36179 [Bombardia bombarda]|uniref:Uncharacterized protein n=1 Tax=Bombardia bombarda TaxID=252184 RepID=A0AA39XL15_9PEZI|nr:hypothetical protein B0T17DRAFT_36179 [Bombardia bombarda]